MNRYFRGIKKFLLNKNWRTSLFFQLGVYDNVDDEEYLRMKFKLRMGKELNLSSPKTFNEKIQWLKLYDRKPLYTTLVDKYEVKKYVANIIGEEHIIPTIGIWNSFDDITFDSLPNQFVLKCTHDSGGLAICRDKNSFNIKAAQKKIDFCMRRNYFMENREWPYKNVPHRIIAEQYMVDESGYELKDYKFFCFDGEPRFLYLSKGLENHSTASISFVNLDWSFASFKRSDYKAFRILPEKPENFEEMINIARVLSAGYPFLRVDLYNIAGKIFFSELTFSPCGGMLPFEPEEWDYRLGELIQLPEFLGGGDIAFYGRKVFILKNNDSYVSYVPSQEGRAA